MIDAKAELVSSLDGLNQQVLAKLDGLGEYDLRRPLSPTGTNLLGVLKHLAAGRFAGDPSVPGDGEIDWSAHVAEIEAAARRAAER